MSKKGSARFLITYQTLVKSVTQGLEKYGIWPFNNSSQADVIRSLPLLVLCNALILKTSRTNLVNYMACVTTIIDRESSFKTLREVAASTEPNWKKIKYYVFEVVKYDKNKWLGNTPGLVIDDSDSKWNVDAVKFRGLGQIQITGRYNMSNTVPSVCSNLAQLEAELWLLFPYISGDVSDTASTISKGNPSTWTSRDLEVLFASTLCNCLASATFILKKKELNSIRQSLSKVVTMSDMADQAIKSMGYPVEDKVWKDGSNTYSGTITRKRMMDSRKAWNLIINENAYQIINNLKIIS